MPGWVIYAVRATDGREYVGYTADLKKRRAGHYSKARKPPKNKKHGVPRLLCEAIKRDGRKLKWRVIDTAETEAEAERLEAHYIDKLGTMETADGGGGLNCRTGGKTTYTEGDGTRARKSTSAKERVSTPEGAAQIHAALATRWNKQGSKEKHGRAIRAAWLRRKFPDCPLFAAARA